MPAIKSQGKSDFLKEYLTANPKSNPAAVNEAWTKAGMVGSISTSLVNKLRTEMGLTGNLPRGKKPKAKPGRKPGRSAKEATQAANGTTSSRRLVEVEAELDRLLFTVMGIGNLAEVEESLRGARRALYRSLNA